MSSEWEDLLAVAPTLLKLPDSSVILRSSFNMGIDKWTQPSEPPRKKLRLSLCRNRAHGLLKMQQTVTALARPLTLLHFTRQQKEWSRHICDHWSPYEPVYMCVLCRKSIVLSCKFINCWSQCMTSVSHTCHWFWFASNDEENKESKG